MSTLRTNALEGVDAKNSITIVAGAGNITTTNVQEGLAKAWVNFNGTGTIATRDSNNISSLTDNSTGNYSCNLSNSFSSANYSYTAMSGYTASGTGITSTISESTTTSALFAIETLTTSGGAADSANVNSSAHGDLA